MIINVRKDHLASASADLTVKIWNYKSSLLLETLKGHKKTVMNLVLLNEESLASCSLDKTVKNWNLTAVLARPNNNSKVLEYGKNTEFLLN
jgi:WD40 repeat protein